MSVELKMSYGDTTRVRTPMVALQIAVDENTGEVRVDAWTDVPHELSHIFDNDPGMMTPKREQLHGGERLTFLPERVKAAASPEGGSDQ